MGSFCTGKPATTTSSQTYTPAGISQLNDIYARISSAASRPYSPYTGPTVAGLTPTQTGGIDKIVGATDYLDTASDYARSGAAPIGEDEIARYYNPFQRDVIDSTQRNFAESNAVADERLKGNAISAGAWGGDRAGIARAELMRQQKLAQDPVIAGLNSQGFNLALAAAQADRAARAQGGYQFGALHNAALAGGQSQIGAGSLEQGTNQAYLTDAYRRFTEAEAFPYQQAQYLASTGLPVISAMGGTQAGQTTQMPTQPSKLSQAIGIGMTALGAMTGNPFMAMGGMGGMSGGNIGGTGLPGFGGLYRRGGAVRRHGDFIDTVRALRESLRRGGPVIDMHRDGNGIYVPSGYADGGGIPFLPLASNGIYLPESSPFADRFDAVNELQDRIAPFSYAPMAENPMASPSMPMPNANGTAVDAAPAALPPPSGEPAMSDFSSQSARPLPSPARMAPDYAEAEMPFVPGRPARSQGTGPFGLSDEARLGLISAGLGIMASQNPNALGAIGEGGLVGVKVYAGAKQSRERNELAARKLIQSAEQFAKGHDLRERSLTETKRYHDVLSDDRRDAMFERARMAQERSEDRRDVAARTAYPGEGLDAEGKTVRGIYQFNPDTRQYDFKPGVIMQKGATAADRKGQTERLVEELRKENPMLTYQEALALTKRAPNADQTTLRRESLALSAAKADLEYLRDSAGTLEKWRKQYGLPPAGDAAAGTPGRGGNLRKPSDEILAKAREAIKAGKDRTAVIERLRQNGFDPSGL